MHKNGRNQQKQIENIVQNDEMMGSSVYLRIMMENLCRVYYNDCKCF